MIFSKPAYWDFVWPCTFIFPRKDQWSWRSRSRSRSIFGKITHSDLDHTKDQDQCGWSWSFRGKISDLTHLWLFFTLSYLLMTRACVRRPVQTDCRAPKNVHRMNGKKILQFALWPCLSGIAHRPRPPLKRSTLYDQPFKKPNCLFSVFWLKRAW